MELVNDRWTKGQTMKRGLLCALLWSSLISTQGQGTILWDEAVNGSLSEDYVNPTQLLTLQLGTNSLFGVSEVVTRPPNWEAHANFFTLQIPNGMHVSTVFVHIDKPDVWAWIGATGFSEHIGYTLSMTNGDLLPQCGLTAVSPGIYGVYVQNSDLNEPVISIANFRLDFVVQPIPEPAIVWLLLGGLSGPGFRRWIRKPSPRTD